MFDERFEARPMRSHLRPAAGGGILRLLPTLDQGAKAKEVMPRTCCKARRRAEPKPSIREDPKERREIPRSRNAPSGVGGRGQRLLLSRFCRLVLTLPCRRGCPLNCREELLGILGGQPAVIMQGGRGRRCHLDVALQAFDLPKLLANAPSGRFGTPPVETPAFPSGLGHAPAPGAKQLCS